VSEILASQGALRVAAYRDELNIALRAQGDVFLAALNEQHAHLFAALAVDMTAANLAQMRAVIAAVEEVVQRDECLEAATLKPTQSLGVFYGYDFHLNADGAHLIEINTNAGGAFCNALLYGQAAVEAEFLAMFRNEWRLACGDAPLVGVAIVDEQPQRQYLYPEFILAQQMFQRAGIAAYIVDPSDLQARDDGLYAGEQKIALIYNRLTDFSLQRFPHLLAASEKQQVLITPNPAHYQRYADKRKLALLTDETYLRALNVSQASVDALLRGVPQTRVVNADDAEMWWTERKQWFFKPVNGYGGKGAYRGDKVTKRVFGEIMQSDYVAQRLALPGECVLITANGESQSLKYDVRCYVYDGKIQLVAARLYQGQTTNFRTPGGGFAVVRVVG
jgi:glutathione synthase/RimK-type ligase-like ATP-grasp enzyme